MKTSRRKFIGDLGMAGIATFTVPSIFAQCKAGTSLNVLVLGGTNFLGPAIVKSLLKSGHEVTLFNRGVTNPHLFPDLQKIRGDREKGLSGYANLRNLGENWDVVIDVWPQKSKLVDEATMVLKKKTKHYIYVSSIAVYNNYEQIGLNEEYEVVSLELDKSDWGYPEEKLAAELCVKERFKENHTILRAGPIKGWRDPAIDLLYWCIKLNRDSAIIAPGSGKDHLQFIDVNDIGKFAAMAVQNEFYGIYNCTGPKKEPLLWKDFLESAKKHFNSKTELLWGSEEFLAANKIASYGHLPLWTSLSEDAFMQISNEKLIQAGFEFTPIEFTLEDCIKWYRTSMSDQIKFGTEEIEIGLEREEELKLIKKLKG